MVLVSTAVAFLGRPEMVAARFLASLGHRGGGRLLWTRLGREDWIEAARRRTVEGETRWRSFIQVIEQPSPPYESGFPSDPRRTTSDSYGSPVIYANVMISQ